MDYTYLVSNYNYFCDEYTDKETTVYNDDVLKLMANGYTNKEIAAALFLSPNTIRTHSVNIYDKMGLRTRLEAVNEFNRVF